MSQAPFERCLSPEDLEILENLRKADLSFSTDEVQAEPQEGVSMSEETKVGPLTEEDLGVLGDVDVAQVPTSGGAETHNTTGSGQPGQVDAVLRSPNDADAVVTPVTEQTQDTEDTDTETTEATKGTEAASASTEIQTDTQPTRTETESLENRGVLDSDIARADFLQQQLVHVNQRIEALRVAANPTQGENSLQPRERRELVRLRREQTQLLNRERRLREGAANALDRLAVAIRQGHAEGRGRAVLGAIRDSLGFGRPAENRQAGERRGPLARVRGWLDNIRNRRGVSDTADQSSSSEHETTEQKQRVALTQIVESLKNGGIKAAQETWQRLQDDPDFRDALLLTGFKLAVRAALGPMGIVFGSGPAAIGKFVVELKKIQRERGMEKAFNMLQGTLQEKFNARTGNATEKTQLSQGELSKIQEELAALPWWQRQARKVGELLRNAGNVAKDVFMSFERAGYMVALSANRRLHDVEVLSGQFRNSGENPGMSLDQLRNLANENNILGLTDELAKFNRLYDALVLLELIDFKVPKMLLGEQLKGLNRGSSQDERLTPEALREMKQALTEQFRAIAEQLSRAGNGSTPEQLRQKFTQQLARAKEMTGEGTASKYAMEKTLKMRYRMALVDAFAIIGRAGIMQAVENALPKAEPRTAEKPGAPRVLDRGVGNPRAYTDERLIPGGVRSRIAELTADHGTDRVPLDKLVAYLKETGLKITKNDENFLYKMYLSPAENNLAAYKKVVEELAKPGLSPEKLFELEMKADLFAIVNQNVTGVGPDIVARATAALPRVQQILAEIS